MMRTCPDEAVQNLTVPFASNASLGNLVHQFDLQLASKMGKRQYSACLLYLLGLR